MSESATDAGAVSDWRKLKKVPRPDREVLQKDLDNKEVCIKDVLRRIGDIKDELSGGAKRREEIRTQTDAVRNKITEIGTQIDKKVEEKRAVQELIGNADRARSAANKELNQQRRNVKFASVADIHKAIKDLQFTLSTESLEMVEEKRIMSEIQSLEANMKGMMDAEAKSESAKTEKSKVDSYFELSRQHSDSITALLKQRDAERKKLKDILDAEKARSSDKDQLNKERDELQARIEKIRAEKDEIRKKFDADMDAWRESEKKVRQLQKAEDDKRREERRAEIEKYEEERLASYMEERKRNPHLDSILEVNQLIVYLEGLSGKPSAAPAAAAVAMPTAADLASKFKDAKFKGRVLMPGQRDEGLSGLFAGMQQKPKKDLKRKEKKTSGGLHHSLDLFPAFRKFGVDVPLVMEDVPSALEALRKKKQSFDSWQAPSDEEIRKEVEERRQKRAAAAGFGARRPRDDAEAAAAPAEATEAVAEVAEAAADAAETAVEAEAAPVAEAAAEATEAAAEADA